MQRLFAGRLDLERIVTSCWKALAPGRKPVAVTREDFGRAGTWARSWRQDDCRIAFNGRRLQERDANFWLAVAYHELAHLYTHEAHDEVFLAGLHEVVYISEGVHLEFTDDIALQYALRERDAGQRHIELQQVYGTLFAEGRALKLGTNLGEMHVVVERVKGPVVRFAGPVWLNIETGIALDTAKQKRTVTSIIAG